MKILVHPSSIENIKDLENKNIDGIIIGLKNYSIFQSVKLDIDSIKLFKSKLFQFINYLPKLFYIYIIYFFEVKLNTFILAYLIGI